MRQMTFIFIVFLYSLNCSAQDYSFYLNNGTQYYNDNLYLKALEYFDLAYEFAQNSTQKSEAKSWKNRSRNKIRQQQDELKLALAKSDSLLIIANKRYENTNKILMKLLPDIPKEESEAPLQIVHIGDSLFRNGKYQLAINKYELAKLSIKAEYVDSVSFKINQSKKCFKYNSIGLNKYYDSDFFFAKKYFDSTIIINPFDEFAQRVSEYCLSPKDRKRYFIEVTNPDLVKVNMSKYMITNIEFVRFLNQYGTIYLKKGVYKGKKFIKLIEIVKKDEKYIVKPGAELKSVRNVSRYGVTEYCDFFDLELLPASVIEKNKNKIEKSLSTEWCKEESIGDGLISNSHGRMWFYNPIYTIEHIGFRAAYKK